MGPAEKRLRSLAEAHGVSAQRLPLDDWADQVSRLSDAEVPADELADLVVALRRAEAIDGVELTRLHSAVLDERDRPPPVH